MDDFPGLLARDFGFRPQGKSAPMAAAKTSSFGSGSASTRSATAASPFAFDDVFGGAPKRQGNNNPPPPPSFDSIFDGFKDPNPKSSSMPGPAAYDKPVYDDDIFDGVPGIKTGSVRVEYEDVFASMSKGGVGKAKEEEEDDLLGSLGRSSSSREETRTKKRLEDLDAFNDLIPGFGGSSLPAARR